MKNTGVKKVEGGYYCPGCRERFATSERLLDHLRARRDCGNEALLALARAGADAKLAEREEAL